MINSYHIKHSLGHLSSALSRVTNWATEKFQMQPQPSLHAHGLLSEYLDATVFDVDAFGSVPELIDYRIRAGIEDASFLVTNLTTVVEQFDQWKRELPMVEPFYAMKCNPDPVIIKLLATLGCGFDCATMGEIDLVLHGLGNELSFGP